MGDVTLGIDLGTTNSVVAVADGAKSRVLTDSLGNRLIPSVVSFKPDGTIVVGDPARDRRLIDARNTVYSVKRLIGRPFSSPEVKRAQERFAFQLVENANGAVVVDVRGETFTLTEISAFVLREVRRVAEERLGHKANRAVITVPANFNELQRSATKAAGRVAGLEVARIINEPTAAALAYGYGKNAAEKVAVFDLGGGTFDLTILELEDDVFEVVATAGDSFLGGDDLDVAITEAMCESMLKQHRWDPREDPQAYERVRAAAEWVKCQLSTDDLVEVTVEELGHGEGGKSIDLDFQMSRDELEGRVQSVLACAFDVCTSALKEAGLSKHDLDSVVLVGGSTRVPLVRSMVSEFFQKEPRMDIDPDLVVAQGAAIHGYAIAGKGKAAEKVSLRETSMAEFRQLRKQRMKEQDGLPKQPAFAPEYQIEDLEMPSARPVGPTSTSGLISLELDDPLAVAAREAAERQKEETLHLDDVSDFPPVAPRPKGSAVSPPALPPLVVPTAPAIAVGSASKISSLPSDALESLPPLDLESLPPADVRAPKKTRAKPPAPPPPPAPPVRPDGTQPFELPTLDPFDLEVPHAAITEGLAPIRIGESTKSIEQTLPFRTGVEAAPIAPPASAPLAISQPSLDLPDKAPPILMDVTPHSLGLETAGGYCQHLISRSAPIPTEQSRVFTTAADGQESVVVRICQGEERAFDANEPLGAVELTDLPAAIRGAVQINVTFMLDASGTLDVRAVDEKTGKAQSIQINLLGGASDDDIERMQERQQAMLST